MVVFATWACAQRAECRPTLQIVRLSRCSAAREATRSSLTAQEPEHELLRLNRQYTSYRCRFTGHSSSIGHSRTMDGAASWTLLPAHPPRRGMALGFSASVSGLWCGISATAGVAAHDDHDERRRVRVCTHPPGGGHPVNPRGRHLRTFQARRGILDPLCAGLPSQAICACSFRSHVRAPSFVFRFLLLDWYVRLLRPVG